jgi:hypothetical protein
MQMSDALLKQLELQSIISLFEMFLFVTGMFLALSGFCGLGVVIGALPPKSAAMFFGGAIGCFLAGLLVTALRWCFWWRRWAGREVDA